MADQKGTPVFNPHTRYSIRVPEGVTKGNVTWFGGGNGNGAQLHANDELKGVQSWHISPVHGKAGHFHIKLVDRSGDRARHHFLSCRDDGFVDLWHTDDNSGHQQWAITAVPGDAHGRFIIRAAKPGNMLSTTEAGHLVALWHQDDASGRQRWAIEPTGMFHPHVHHTIRMTHGVNGKLNTLSVNNSTKVDLWERDDGSGRQRWSITAVRPGVYHIRVVERQGEHATHNFLSCRDDGHVDLWKEDDNSGHQQWAISKVPGDAHGRYNIKAVKPGNFLSTTEAGHLVALWHVDDASGRQRWTITPL